MNIVDAIYYALTQQLSQDPGNIADLLATWRAGRSLYPEHDWEMSWYAGQGVDVEGLNIADVRYEYWTNFATYNNPAVGDERISEAGDIRVTEAGDTRIIDVLHIRISEAGDVRITENGLERAAN